MLLKSVGRVDDRKRFWSSSVLGISGINGLICFLDEELVSFNVFEVAFGFGGFLLIVLALTFLDDCYDGFSYCFLIYATF